MAERDGNWLADLNVTEPLGFTPGGSGTQPIGTLVRQTEGLILTFSVAERNTGAILTMPADEATTNALTSVGC